MCIFCKLNLTRPMHYLYNMFRVPHLISFFFWARQHVRKLKEISEAILILEVLTYEREREREHIYIT